MAVLRNFESRSFLVWEGIHHCCTDWEGGRGREKSVHVCTRARTHAHARAYTRASSCCDRREGGVLKGK